MLVSVLAAALLTAPAAQSPRSSTESPFEYRDGLIWIQVRLKESGAPLNFLLDSGAGISVVNLSTLERISHLRGRRVSVRGVEAATVGYWPQRLSAAVDGLPLPSDFLAVDLTALSRDCGRTVDGLIGADFFCRHAVQIDFASRTIRLAGGDPSGANTVCLPLESQRGALRIPISVNHGPRQSVRLDTGCAAALHWVSAARPPDESTPHVSVGLAPLNVAMTRVSVQLGPITFDSVQTGLHRKEIFAGEAGLLGNDLLSRFDSVTIDAPAGRVVLQGAPHAPAP